MEDADVTPVNTNAVALSVPPNNHLATRVGGATGTYHLKIGVVNDPEGDDEEIASKGIEQIIYENVYYSPLILPTHP